MEIVSGTWSWPLIVTSFLVSAVGSFTSIYCAKRVRSDSGARLTWLIAAALAMGGGAIWSMHFIGMLALDMHMPVRYDLAMTLGSLLIAVVVTGLGLLVASGPTSGARLVSGGAIMGIGVAAMHYTGMAAMRMGLAISYDTRLVVTSVVIAVVAATAALFLAFNLERASHIWLSALVMATAVCGMHYTGMAAATFHTAPGLATPAPGGVSSLVLGYGVFMVTMVLLLGTLYQALYSEASAEKAAVVE